MRPIGNKQQNTQRPVLPRFRLAQGSMRYEKYSKYSYAHFKDLEKEGNVTELLAALDAPEVQKSPGRRCAIITSLRRIGTPEGAAAISKLLDREEPDSVRRSAAQALGPIGNPEALPALRAALDDPSKEVQMWTMKSLGELRDREQFDTLVRRLEDDDSSVRAFAAMALGEIGDQRATKPLAKALDDRNGGVRGLAIGALVKLRDPHAVAALKSARDQALVFRRHTYARGLRRLEEVLP